MSRRTPTGLAGRLMTAQVLVIAVGAFTMVAAIALVAPGLFRAHLARTEEGSPQVLRHAEAAFTSAFAISLSIATGAALVTAGLVSWFLVRRVAHPVEQLAHAADLVAAGSYRVEIPVANFSSELERLSDAFSHMAGRLADTDAARSRLLSDLAHELRTPLATLEAFIDGIEDGVVPDDATARTTMRAQLARLRRLATDVRETAAAEEHALGLVLAPCDAGAIGEAAVSAARPRYQAKSVNLEFERPAACTVRADQERLHQVLANLLDNALRHTPSGGHVQLTVASDTTHVRFQVRDDGEGIPPDQLETVFQRFHRADPARISSDGAGSGLGLTIARAIVADHAGTLTASSAGPGHGAVLTVTLPIEQPTSPRSPRPARP
ncbi:MAG: ATP-binding protein [Sporichthyaceae bacterium]